VSLAVGVATGLLGVAFNRGPLAELSTPSKSVKQWPAWANRPPPFWLFAIRARRFFFLPCVLGCGKPAVRAHARRRDRTSGARRLLLLRFAI